VKVASILPPLLVSAIVAVTPTAAAAQQPQGQGKPGTVEATQRFQGTTRVGPPGSPDSVRVDVRLWSIAGRQKITQLELPFTGDLIAELRGGRLTTVIDGRRAERHEGEIWLLPVGTRMSLETMGDMATLQTWLVAR
jgi:hypothetical protein